MFTFVIEHAQFIVDTRVALKKMATEDIFDEGTITATSQAEIKIFGKWDPNEVQIEDISLAVS